MTARIATLCVAAMAALAISTGVVRAQDAGQDDASELAKKLQNPIGSLISVPFQNVTNFQYGPNHGTQNILNIQPVIPFAITDDLNVITRTVVPLIWQPSMQPAASVPFGLGPSQFSAFVSPSKPMNGWVFGAGPVVQLPTATSATLGSSVWGGGPTAVAVHSGGRWVYGALLNAIWSFGGEQAGGTKYNSLYAQPFLNYNFDGGWYVGTGPQITANWPAARNKAWTVPVGAQVGRVIKVGALPINLSLGAYYNVVRPQFGATWQLRTQVTFIF